MKNIKDLIKCDFDINILGVTDDSRNVKEGYLFVATKGYHEDIIEMFFPKSNYVYYNLYLKEPRLGLIGDFKEFNGRNYRQIFSQRHFNVVNSNLGRIHYFDAMLQTLGLNRADASKPTPKLPKKVVTKVTKIAEEIGLDLNKFVILDDETKKVITAHSTNPVPLILTIMSP